MEKREILPQMGKDQQIDQQYNKINFRANSSQNNLYEDLEKNQIQKEQINLLKRSLNSFDAKDEQNEKETEFKSDNMVFELIQKQQKKEVNFKNDEMDQNQNQDQNQDFSVMDQDEQGENGYGEYEGQVQMNNLMNDDIQLSLVYQENQNQNYNKYYGDRENMSGSPYHIDYQNYNGSSNNLNSYNKKLGFSGLNKKTAGSDVNSVHNYSTATNFHKMGSRVVTTHQGSRKNRTLIKGQYSQNHIDINYLEQSAVQFDNYQENQNSNQRYRRAISQSNQKRIVNNRGVNSQMKLDNSFYTHDKNGQNFNKSFSYKKPLNLSQNYVQPKVLNQTNQSMIQNPYYQAKNFQSNIQTPTQIQQKKGQSFQNIKSLSKFSKNINSGMMEKWINDTIMESELYVPDKGEKFEVPLKNYKLDLISLSGKDVNKESIQRMYRCLFVYSLGFYEMLNQIFDHAKDKNILIASVWKIFGILLESCSKEEYSMVIIELEKQKILLKQEMDKEIQKQKDIISKIESRENEIKERLELQIKQLQIEKQNLLIDQRKIQSDFVQADNAYNQEVTIRLKFEHKINEVNSIHRELLIKHERLLKDFKQIQKQVDDHNKEIMERTNNQVKQQSQISLLKQSDRQNGQTIELYRLGELKQKEKFDEYEKNIKNLYREKGEFQKKIHDLENHLSILKMENGNHLGEISIQKNLNEEMTNLVTLLRDEKEEQKKITEKQFGEIKRAQIEISSVKNSREEITKKHDLLDKKFIKIQKELVACKRELEDQEKKQRDNMIQIESQQLEIESHKKRIENLERAVKFIKESKLQADLYVEDIKEKMSIVKEEYLALQKKQQDQIKYIRELQKQIEDKNSQMNQLQHDFENEQEKNEQMSNQYTQQMEKKIQEYQNLEEKYEEGKQLIDKLQQKQSELYNEMMTKTQELKILQEDRDLFEMELKEKRENLEQKIEETKQLHKDLIETKCQLQTSQDEKEIAENSLKTISNLKNREIQFLFQQKEELEKNIKSSQKIEQIYYEDIYSQYQAFKEQKEVEIKEKDIKIHDFEQTFEEKIIDQKNQFLREIEVLKEKNQEEILKVKENIQMEKQNILQVQKEKEELYKEIQRGKREFNEVNLQLLEVKQEKTDALKEMEEVKKKIKEFEEKIKKIQQEKETQLSQVEKKYRENKEKQKSSPFNSQIQNINGNEDDAQQKKEKISVQVHNLIAMVKEKNDEQAKLQLQEFFNKQYDLEQKNNDFAEKIIFLQNQKKNPQLEEKQIKRFQDFEENQLEQKQDKNLEDFLEIKSEEQSNTEKNAGNGRNQSEKQEEKQGNCAGIFYGKNGEVFVFKNSKGEILGAMEVEGLLLGGEKGIGEHLKIESFGTDFDKLRKQNIQDKQGNQVIIQNIGRINKQSSNNNIQDQELYQSKNKSKSNLNSPQKKSSQLKQNQSQMHNKNDSNQSQNKNKNKNQSQVYQNVSNLISQNNSSQIQKSQKLNFNLDKSRNKQNDDIRSQLSEYSPTKYQNLENIQGSQNSNFQNYNQSQVESEQDLSTFIGKDQQNQYNLQSKLEQNQKINKVIKNQSFKGKNDLNKDQSNLIFQKTGSVYSSQLNSVKNQSQVRNLSQAQKEKQQLFQGQDFGQIQEINQEINNIEQKKTQISKEQYNGPKQKAGDFARKFQIQANYYNK